MADLWIPGVTRRLIPSRPGEPMAGGSTRKAIIHTTETPTIPIYAPEPSRPGSPFPPHVTIDTRVGATLQHIPANLSAYALLHAGAPETNRFGLYCVQIEIVGYAIHPFTEEEPWSALKGWPEVHAWLQSLGIPDVWPAGAPPKYPPAPPANAPGRSSAIWTTKSGYFGHSQVPNNLHGDPGAIDVDKLTGDGGGDELTPAQEAQLLLASHAGFVDEQEARHHGLSLAPGSPWRDDLAKIRVAAARKTLGVTSGPTPVPTDLP